MAGLSIAAKARQTLNHRVSILNMIAPDLAIKKRRITTRDCVS